MYSDKGKNSKLIGAVKKVIKNKVCLLFIFTLLMLIGCQIGVRAESHLENTLIGNRLNAVEIEQTRNNREMTEGKQHGQDLAFLLKLVDDFNGQVSTGTVEAYADIKNTRMTKREMRVMLDKLVEKLQMEHLVEEQFINSTNFGDEGTEQGGSLVSVSGEKEGLQIQIIIQSIWGNDLRDQDKTVITLKAIKLFDRTNDSPNSLSKYQEKFSSVFNFLQLDGEITTCLSGFLSDKLTEDEQTEFLKTQFKDSKITQHEKFNTYNEIITSGYSSKIENFIMVGERKTNLSLSLSNEYGMDKTSFRIAIPLIYSDY